jgi:carboxypeptidase C (cathepsin A)
MREDKKISALTLRSLIRGPGATSELGQFKGIGPCAVSEDGNSTRRLEFSWIDHANVVFIE